MKSTRLLVAALFCAGCAGAKPEAVVRVAVPFELDALDPHAEDKLSSFAILCNLYEPLVRTDAGIGIEPGLAEAWDSPDPLTWVFHMRRGVCFHGGKPMVAADVVFSFRRLLADQQLEVRNYLADVERIDAVGDDQVRIRMRVPTRFFLNRLGYVFIVPDGSSDEALRTGADGTGPYRLAAWVKGVSLRLLRAERHWHGTPRVPAVEFRLSAGAEQAIQGLRSSQYQLIRADTRKLEALVSGSPSFAIMRQDNLYSKYLAYDLAHDVTPFCATKRNPFKDARVRRALHIGVDRHRLVRELSNYALPATQPVPRFVFGFNPAIAEANYDPDGARALLRDAGFGAGFDVVLHARRVVADAAGLIADDLRQIGVRAQLEVLPDAEFFSLLRRHGSSLWINRFACLTGDAAEFLDDLVHSNDPARHFGAINYGGHADADLDRAIERLASIEGVDARRNAIQDVMRRVVEKLVVVPLYNDQDVYARSTSLQWRPRSDSNIQAVDFELRR